MFIAILLFIITLAVLVAVLTPAFWLQRCVSRDFPERPMATDMPPLVARLPGSSALNAGG